LYPRPDLEEGKMATFKVIAGDFGQGGTGQVLVGNMYRESAQGFNMPVAGRGFEIQTLEVATEETIKRMGGAIGWGLAGGLVLGPVGALAGVLAGGRGKSITFICQFRDGRKFLGSCNPNTFTAIQAACFPAPDVPQQKTETHVVVARALAAIGFLLIAILVIGALLLHK
jgi:hypothetical protein